MDSAQDSESTCQRFKSQCYQLAGYVSSLGKMWTPCIATSLQRNNYSLVLALSGMCSVSQDPSQGWIVPTGVKVIVKHSTDILADISGTVQIN